MIDNFNRKHNYLRISLTERCNLRCFYCMPEDGVPLRHKAHFMTSEEIVALAKIFVAQGVDKIRITGGEPLIKKDFENIITNLGALNVKLHLTTNGILVDKYISVFKKVGLKDINVSIDSLKEEKFNAITKRKYFQKVMDNIQLLLKEDFKVKLNVVLMKDWNEDEIISFIELSKNNKLAIRFIEFMPFDGNQWDTSKVVTYHQIMDRVQNHFGPQNVLQISPLSNDTAKNFLVKGYVGTFGIISSVTNPFCDSCNRLRLTADGKLKNCLFSAGETDLLTAYRKEEDVLPLIQQSLNNKHAARAGIGLFNNENKKLFEANRNMTSIGG
ncbi:GTP 3',8-cyclase MoaA [Putridiphycobacter roseus]|uniref:GTP 3',8-cyclase n=1 Tax=Putridiphycobacter roseus TaxID=2219161 RepID=A0A2W1NGE7_9FLAO|nr:GTP 3',8-cyclase MoaA [Putridiphycobacter roseus]PZE17106.1 GTP 3',8-cyclase MoaA [Putridiphycobacter roseus]